MKFIRIMTAIISVSLAVSELITLNSNADFKIGDLDGNEIINASDASLVLSEYAALSTGKESILTLEQKNISDINNDGFIDSVDASKILSYYAYQSAGGSINFEEYLNNPEYDMKYPKITSSSVEASASVGTIYISGNYDYVEYKIYNNNDSNSFNGSGNLSNIQLSPIEDFNTSDITWYAKITPYFNDGTAGSSKIVTIPAEMTAKPEVTLGYVKTYRDVEGTKSLLYIDGNYDYVEVNAYSTYGGDKNSFYSSVRSNKGESDPITMTSNALGMSESKYLFADVTPYFSSGKAGETVTYQFPEKITVTGQEYKMFYRDLVASYNSSTTRGSSSGLFSKAYNKYALIFINNDNIPELLVTNSQSGAGVLYTVVNDERGIPALRQVHYWEYSRDASIERYMEKQNMFITFACPSSWSITYTSINKILEDGSGQRVQTANYDGWSGTEKYYIDNVQVSKYVYDNFIQTTNNNAINVYDILSSYSDVMAKLS